MKTRTLLIIALLVIGFASAMAFRQSGQQADAPGKGQRGGKVDATVIVALAQQADIPLQLEATGTVTPLQSVDIKPQTAGVVKKVLVKEGQNVGAGDVLFLLEDDAERAALNRAKAQLARDQAQLADADRTLERNRSLSRDGFLSPSAVDTAQSTVDGLRAAITADRAAIESAQIELDRKTIRAAIPGRAGSVGAFPGTVVQPGMATAMVTLVQMTPVTISFTLPESGLSSVRAAQVHGTLPVEAYLSGQDKPVAMGKLVFIDNIVDTRSGTIRAKAEFDNRDTQLWPGAYAKVKLSLGKRADALIIPVTGVQTGPEHRFAYVLQPDQTVKAVPLTLVSINEDRAIVDGLAVGQAVVISGGQNLKPGDKVKTTTAQKNEATANLK
ncbi:efflux RND transporter periplasmic adaptor subunit [Chitinivorax sp. B]|uniref:efflux RND transporter periplasmic adaptor subunit n=1 Tax=Chitinivorax sp. B TaxID=2502235 RepID=UPI0010F478C5|nr:efflux RND transporter periplasmic adaptor subunit [Chitinivorax sp. B]